MPKILCKEKIDEAEKSLAKSCQEIWWHCLAHNREINERYFYTTKTMGLLLDIL